MDLHRLSAAGGALALHALALAAALTLAVGPPALRRVEPVQVALLAPPEPLPLAAPAPRAVPEPPRAEPPRPEPPWAEPPRATPPAPKPPPRPVRAAPPRPAPPAPAPATAPEPPREAASIPPPAPAPAAPAAPAPAQPDAPSIAAAASSTAASSAAAAPSAPLASARSTRSDAPGVPAGPTRLAPRVDATWSGNTPPPYPPMARRMGDEGEVRLDVRVGADGRVTDIRLKQSSGSALLDRTAIDTVRKWRFKPATVDGQPVAEWYHDWRWVFRLEG